MNDGADQRVCDHGRPEEKEGEVARDILRRRGEPRRDVGAAGDGRMSGTIATQSQERIEDLEKAGTGQTDMMTEKLEHGWPTRK